MYFKFTLVLLCTLSLLSASMAQTAKLELREVKHPIPEKAWQDIKTLKVMMLRQQALQEILTTKPEVLILSLLTQTGSSYDLKMVRQAQKPLKVRVSQGEVSTISLVQYRVKNNTSISAITFYSDGVNVIMGGVVTDKYGIVNELGSLPDDPLYVAYYAQSELPASRSPQCHQEELPQQYKKLGSNLRSQIAAADASDSCKSVKISLELDYTVFTENGSSLGATVGWAYSLFNVIGIFYKRERINVEIEEVYLHTKPDNYPTVTSRDALNAFGDTLAIRGFTGNLSHLISLGNYSNGGIAYLDVLCEPGFNYGYSNANLSFSRLPATTWTVNVIAHELGHNFGSPHTHYCGWEFPNGQIAPIDSCYEVQGIGGQAPCYTGLPVPRIGTVMSYCHLNARNDLNLGFGPLPGNLIRQRYNDAICLTPGTFIADVLSSYEDTICSGSSLMLPGNATSGITYVWTGPNNFRSTAPRPTITNIQQNQAGQYNLVATRGTCTSNPIPFNVVLNCINVSNISSASLCQGESATLTYKANFTPPAANRFVIEFSTSSAFSTVIPVDTVAAIATSGTLQWNVPSALVASIYYVRLRSIPGNQIGKALSQTISVSAKATRPTVTNGSRIGAGIVTLQAVNAGNISKWYDNLTDLQPLAVGNTFVTPSLATSRTYYAEADPTARTFGGITNRTAFAGAQLPNVNHGLYFTVLQAMRLDTVTVYPASSGTVRVSILNSTTLSEVFSRSYTVTSSTSGTMLRIATALKPGSYLIRANSSMVNALYRNNVSPNTLPYPFTLGSLASITGSTAGDNGSTSYYYFFYNWRVSSFGCPSERVAVQAIINSQNCTPPAKPIINNVARCGAGSATLAISNPASGVGYNLYDRQTGGIRLSQSSSASITSPVFTRTDTLWVSSYTIGQAICESARSLGIVTINTIPATPTIPAAARCSTGAINLLVSNPSTGISYEWRNGQGIVVFTGTSFTTPALTTSTNYSVVARSSAACTSQTAQAVATINSQPTAPVISQNFVRCGAGTLSASLSTPLAGQTYSWFTHPRFGTQLTGNQTFTTPLLTRTDTFFVQLANSNCASSRTPVIFNVNPQPLISQWANVERCGPGQVTFTASSITTGLTYTWFNARTGGIALGVRTVTGNSASFVQSVSVSDSFFVSAAQNTCVGPRKGFLATIKPVPATPLITIQGDSLFSSELSGNQWLFNGQAIAGQTQRYLIISTRPLGQYSVFSTRNGCAGDTSGVFLRVNVSNALKQSIQATPNPFKQNISVTLGEGKWNIRVIDAAGRLIYQTLHAVDLHLIDSHNWPKAMYWLEAIQTNGEARARLKLVKE